MIANFILKLFGRIIESPQLQDVLDSITAYRFFEPLPPFILFRITSFKIENLS